MRAERGNMEQCFLRRLCDFVITRSFEFSSFFRRIGYVNSLERKGVQENIKSLHPII